ncbi:hypothetical protein Tco_0822624 [Tanacetum coccineum]|uniref:Reverse transcriptase domain-containing protein n=1 Tax=Tanacetum coccineum TaxID=301880 RepID=A0ABQ5AFN1_9ASTR
MTLCIPHGDLATVMCNTCNKVGHPTKNYRNKGPATGSNLLPVIITCHACGEKGHYANQYRNTTNNNAQGRAYMLRDRNAHQDPNVVTGMFLLNQHLARVLFDSGVDKSFVSIPFASKLNIPPITIDIFYNIEMADGNLGAPNLVVKKKDGSFRICFDYRGEKTYQKNCLPITQDWKTYLTTSSSSVYSTVDLRSASSTASGIRYSQDCFQNKIRTL